MELLIAISSVIMMCSIITVFLVIQMYRDGAAIKLQITQISSALGTVFRQISDQNVLLNRMGMTLTDFINTMGRMMSGSRGIQLSEDEDEGQSFSTTDGKYTASTLDELIEKIKKDGQAEQYFSENDIDDLRKHFESDDDEDDDEDDIVPPKF